VRECFKLNASLATSLIFGVVDWHVLAQEQVQTVRSPRGLICPAVFSAAGRQVEVMPCERKGVVKSAFENAARARLLQASEGPEAKKFAVRLWCKDRKQGIFDGPATVR
jgi:hypothetical protein